LGLLLETAFDFDLTFLLIVKLFERIFDGVR
jgi:hypothetical protein